MFNVSSLPLIFFSYGHFGTFLPELSLHCLGFRWGGDLLLLLCFFENGLSWSFLYSTPALWSSTSCFKCRAARIVWICAKTTSVETSSARANQKQKTWNRLCAQVRQQSSTSVSSSDCAMGGRQVPLRRQSCLLVRALLLWIACNSICSSQDFAGLDPWKRGFGTGKTTGRCRPSNGWNEVPGGADCLAQRTNDAFETNRKTANIPLLETWESYEASLPVREGTDGVSKLYSQPYLCRGKELDVAVSRLEHANEDRDRVAYLSAPTKRGKSAAILPISWYSVEVWNWGLSSVSPTTSTCHLPITVGIATSLHFNWQCASFCFPLSTFCRDVHVFHVCTRSQPSAA